MTRGFFGFFSFIGLRTGCDERRKAAALSIPLIFEHALLVFFSESICHLLVSTTSQEFILLLTASPESFCLEAHLSGGKGGCVV